jgi:hypothetical protein
MNIPDIEDPFDRYIAFLIERDAIYKKKSAGEPKPWTEDDILLDYKFTEVYRERDRTSLHYQKTIRDYYGQEDAWVLPGTVLYRWFNRIETCEYLFQEPDLDNKSVFEKYLEAFDINRLFHCLSKIPTPHVTGAFIINGEHGYEKGEGVIKYFHNWCVKKDWEGQWKAWLLEKRPTLDEMYSWLREDARGLGPFMAAQIVADLKYLPFMRSTDDWWTWAAPGPGSMKGLNAVYSRPMDTHWKPGEWLEHLQHLREAENKQLVPLGLGPFHAQDTQNHCCEFSKYTKTMLGIGRPRQTYPGR